MNLYLYTYNGNEINDTTNFKARGIGLPSWPIQAGSEPVVVERALNFPSFAGKRLQGLYPVIYISMEGTATSQAATLLGYFDTADNTPRKLISKDAAASDKQWYLYATPVGTVVEGSMFVVTLYVADPIWRSETLNSTSWAVTSSGDTEDITVDGNRNARPIFEITPTSATSSGYAYQRFATVYNRTASALAGYPVELSGASGGLDTAALVKQTGVTNQINKLAGITDSDTTIDIDTAVGGGLPAAGMAIIESEQISWTGNSGTQLTGVTRGIGGTTAAAHADNTVIYNSKMLANGNDIRVIDNGVEVSRWLGSMNDTDTKIWAALNFKPKIELTLGASVSNTGAIGDLTIASTKANDEALKRLATEGGASFVMIVDSEVLLCSAVNTKLRKITVTTRAAKGTSAASHSSGATVRWLEHDLWIVYGNKDAGTPDTDTTYQPVFSYDSTNTVWSYTAFARADGTGSGAWSPAVIKSVGGASYTYTGSHTVDADPATEMGITAACYVSKGKWVSESISAEWKLTNPCGISTVTSNGDKYRSGTSWPTTVALQSSANGTKWGNEWTESSPGSAATWTAWTHNSESITSGSIHVRFVVDGTLAALASGTASFEVQAADVTLASASVPYVALAAEATNYDLNCVIQNDETGEYITLQFPMIVNKTIVVDTDAKTVTYDGAQNAFGALRLSSVRQQWLELAPGTSTLSFTQSGTGNVTVAVKWRDRMAG